MVMIVIMIVVVMVIVVMLMLPFLLLSSLFFLDPSQSLFSISGGDIVGRQNFSGNELLKELNYSVVHLCSLIL